MQFSGPIYDKLKFLVQIVLPAIATLYFTLAQIWGLPAAEQVMGTIAAVATFLGITLQISASNFKSSGVFKGGTMQAVPTPEGTRWELEFDEDPHKLSEAKEAHFRVIPPKP